MSSFISYNPVTGESIGEFPETSDVDVSCAVQRASETANNWAKKSVPERCRALEKLHDLLAADAGRIAELVSEEIGKPLQEAYGAEILPTLNSLNWLVKHAPRILQDRKIQERRGAILSPVPFGVVGIIGTWNYPVLLNLAPIAWALAAGNVVIWKPSELATNVALRLGNFCEQAGLPLTIITGSGLTGRALCRAGCDKIAFTGGVATGRAILAELAKSGTPSVMELSGNDAMLVCADADVTLAARSAVWGRFCNAGQSCVAPQRIYVAAEVYNSFLQECQTQIQTLRPGVDYGPMRTDALRSRANALVWDAVARGATLLAGGRSLEERPGFYYAPTLLSNCQDTMLVMEQDFFGPVLAVSVVANEAEAISRANDCELALGASVWTRNLRHGSQVAAQLKVGLVAINELLLDAADPSLPFGGFRASGFGKQRGAMGLEEFTQWRVTVLHRSNGLRRHLFPYRAATLPILQGITALKSAKGLPAKLHALRNLTKAVMQWQKDDAEK